MRRGQVALFVALGVVLVIGVLLFLFLRKPVTVKTTASERFAPFQSAVDVCLDVRLEQLLREMGANGGYLDTSHLRRSFSSWDGDVVEFPPQTVPFWSHLKPCAANPLGCEATEQPPLCKEGASCPVTVSLPNHAPSIQEQLEAALPNAVTDCLKVSVPQGFSYKPKAPSSAVVLFSDEGVRATLTMPLEVTDLASGETARLTDFTGNADVDLIKVYNLAHDLAQSERMTSFLERLTLDLLAVYGGVDSSIPPMRAVTILGQKRYWSRTRVERLLQEDILPWVDFIQVPNTLGSFSPIWPSGNLSAEEQRMYAGIFYYLYVKPNNTTYPRMKSRFFYPYTKPYLNINGGQELLKPRSANVGGLLQKMVGLFMNDYRFKYDITYPVIVTLTDMDAFKGTGYDWSFALEANIRRNEPVNTSGTATSFVFANEKVDMTAPQQRVRNTIIITTVDKLTNEPIPDARVSYSCGDEYFIGQTNGLGRLVTLLPYCRYGGVLLYGADGYLGDGLTYDNYEEGITKTFTLAMWPLKNVTLSVRKRTPEDTVALMTGSLTYESVRAHSHPLNSSDLVILNIERVKESPYEDDAPLVGFYTFSPTDQKFQEDLDARREQVAQLLAQGILTQQDADDYLATLEASQNKSFGTQPTVTAALAPGAYTVDAFLIHNDVIEIPKETRKFCMVGGGSLCIGKKTFTLNATNFTTWLSGGATLNETDAFSLSENTLYSFTNYTFYVLEEPLPQSWHDLEEYQTPDEYAKGKRLLLLPTWDR